MGRQTIAKPPRPADPDEHEDPVWGNSLVDFFGIGSFGTRSPTPPPAPEDKPAAKKPARKRPKAG